jgi:hypothetical protein
MATHSKKLIRFGSALAFLVLSFLLTQTGLAQQKLDQLLVHGENFMFGVKEPPGWVGDTTNAEQFNSNVVLHEVGQPAAAWIGLIRIRVDEKVDENTSADMAADMKDYKAQHPHVRFKELPIPNSHYRCLAKVFFVPGDFYEYVTYVNPGPNKPILVSVSMNTGPTEATAKELDAYKSAVQSLTVLKP